MTAAGRAARRVLITQAARRLEADGVCWAKWARRHGFRRHSVMKIVRGQRACLHGESHRIAAALIAGTVLDIASWARDLLEALEELAGLCETAVVAVEPGCEADWAQALHRAHRVAERVRRPEAGEELS